MTWSCLICGSAYIKNFTVHTGTCMYPTVLCVLETMTCTTCIFYTACLFTTIITCTGVKYHTLGDQTRGMEFDLKILVLKLLQVLLYCNQSLVLCMQSAQVLTSSILSAWLASSVLCIHGCDSLTDDYVTDAVVDILVSFMLSI